DRVGVDLGISKLATLSCGKVFENPKAYGKALKRLARLHRDLSRKVFQSSNWQKARVKVQKAHRKVADIRSNVIHHLTSYLAKNHGEVVLEDLNVRGLMKNRHLSKALSDAALGMIRQQTEYKCERYSSQLILADRFFPSSQLCSDCGHRQKMPLSIRIFSCEVCNSQKDRDLNASINLENYIAKQRGLGLCPDKRYPKVYHKGITYPLGLLQEAAGSVALRSVDGVLPTVPCEADGKHQQGVQSTVLS
ncbi:MAG: IS200/IS605 family element transposase accessory protein TnpB, partial [Hydrococcus sp. SU_1_0]|nr:IS200/IS605 family element transposase accessory protein TnpB [Hydrococcus sp. SU_1_0]